MKRNKPLVESDEFKKELPLSPVKNQKYRNAARIVLGAVGAGAGFLYWAPSGICTSSPTCGTFLVDAISSSTSYLDPAQTAKWIFFLSGAVGFSGSNMYYSSQVYDNFSEYLNNQNSFGAQIGKGSFVILYGLGQASHMILAVLGTGGELLSATSLLTIGAAIPGSLFGAVGVAKNTLPAIAEKLKWNLTEYVYYSLYSPKDPLEECLRNRIKFYMQEQKQFLIRAEANLKQLISQAKDIDVQVESTELIDFLFQQNAIPANESILSKGVRSVFRLGAIGITTSYIYPLVKNTFEMLKEFVPNPGLQISITALLSTANIYNNYRITGEGVDAIYKTLKSLLTCEKIDSMTFQLKPKSLSSIISVCSSISVLSFAVINVVYDKYYNGAAKDEFRHAARIGIVVNHAYALILFGMVLLRNLTKDPKTKYLFQVEDEVSRLKNQSPAAFADYSESLTQTRKELLGIKTFNGEKPAPSRSWFSWFRCGKKKEDPVDELQLSESAYQQLSATA